jgi:hypothetical protein
MGTALLVVLLFQTLDSNPAFKASADTQRREAQLQQVSHLTSPANPTPSAVAAATEKAEAAANDAQFVGKFNKLIERLVDFAENYREKSAMDVKKAKAVRQAWLELEKSEAIFQDGKKK